MQLIGVIGNSGGAKSTLARQLAAKRGLPYAEIDALLWRPNWELTPPDIYEADHGRLIAGESWVVDGLGSLESIPTEAVFRNFWEVDQGWIPTVRRLVDEEEVAGKRVRRIGSAAELQDFAGLL